MKRVLMAAIDDDSDSMAAHAQDYPAKPIRMILPVLPGGAPDFVGRIVADRLSARLHQKIIVDNRPGAGGIIGLELLKASPPNGYTIASVQSGPLTVSPFLQDNLPYDPLRDFTHITGILKFPLLLVTHPSLPAKNVKELIALARARPGQITYASSGQGGTVHVAAELFNLMAKIRMERIQYKSIAPAIVAVLSGESQLTYSNVPAILPHVKTGRVRALGVTSGERTRSCRTFRRSPKVGLPGYEAYGSAGHARPAELAEGHPSAAQQGDRRGSRIEGSHGPDGAAGHAAGAVYARGIHCVHQDGAQKMGRGRQGGEHQGRMTMNASADRSSRLGVCPDPYQAKVSRWLAMMSCLLLAGITASAFGAASEPLLSLAKKEKPALLETLKELCSIESGSSDREGLDQIAAVIAKRLGALGGKVEMIEPGPDTVRFVDTPEKLGKMVRATFTGKGSAKILLIAHMDTVYPRGMLAKQPFKIEGDRAYGLGIADDRHGIAVILHTLAMLRAMKFSDYGTITVMINGDEEVNSPASRNHITRLGSEHDVVLSFEGGGNLQEDRLRLATSGIAEAILRRERPCFARRQRAGKGRQRTL